MPVRECVEERISLVINTVLEDVDRLDASRLSPYIGKILSFLREGNEVVITYTGMYSSPATYLYILLKSLTTLNAYLVEPELLTYYIAPYGEERGYRAVVINSEGGEGALMRVLDQLNYTGYDVMLLTYNHMPEVIKSKVSDERLLKLPSSDMLLYHTVLGLTVAEYLQRSGVRGFRLWDELSNLKPVVSDLLLTYCEKLGEIKEFIQEPFLITSTPTMVGVAESITYSHSITVPHYLVPLNVVRYYVKYINRVLIVSTDVEEYSLKEVKGLGLTGAVRLAELRVRTDPLTAPIYGLIISKALALI